MPKTTEAYGDFAQETQSVAALLHKRAKEYGEKPFLLFENEKISYAQFNGLADVCAAGLQHLGVQKGTHVVLYLFNSPEWLIAFFALAKLGAVAVTVNTAFKGEALVYPIVQSESRLVITDASLISTLGQVKERLTGVECVVAVERKAKLESADGLWGGKWLRFHELLESGAFHGPSDIPTLGDPLVMIYTSGTTGPSKGCLLPHGFGLYSGFLIQDYLGYTQEDIIYTCLPLFHANALVLSMLPAMIAGASFALSERFSASRFWEEVVRYKATEFNFLGTILHLLFKQPPSDYEKTHRVRVAFGAPVPREIFSAAEERFRVRFVEGYGLTENSIVALWSLQDRLEGRLKIGSMGKETPFAEIAIMDIQTGRILGAGKPGEIVSRPKLPFAMHLNYYKMSEKTIEAWQHLWFHTGDLGFKDEEGVFFFLDRIKDAIRRRGENISSWELEKSILNYPKIAEVGCIAVPSELGEDEIKACIVLKEGEVLAPMEFLSWCQVNLPKFWVPRYIEVLDELPKTPTQRVEKYRLKSQWNTPRTIDLNNLKQP
jgi:crotonobetaine/carnitine-CoA ligase